jgi:hypothetical protein
MVMVILTGRVGFGSGIGVVHLQRRAWAVSQMWVSARFTCLQTLWLDGLPGMLAKTWEVYLPQLWA